MPHPFDPGPVTEPFAALAADYPGSDAYPSELFRVEWGPIFHRGRLDGSAKVLVVGQDPGQHESIGRRAMVGEAGQRVQGFLAKLGITHSYVIVNAFLYSVFGQPSHAEIAQLEAGIAGYRDQWFDALLLDSQIEVVVAFGGFGHSAFESWRGPENAPRVHVEYAPLLHPTYPEGSKAPGGMKKMLDQWNAAIPRLRDAVSVKDAAPDMKPYGDDVKTDEAPIPEADLPVGSPAWMRSLKTWASREDLLAADASKPKKAEAQRATVVVKVPLGERPWTPLDR
ncbi:MAG: uracil-DNA glycosylase [Actinomycetota bacterium]|nr:uracil-DNA glycosylase [Actinomycetota bacterium]